MKYKILNQTNNRIELFILYEDNTYSNINLIGGRPIDEVLKDAYILTNNAANRLPYTEEAPTDLGDYDITPVATTLSVDNFNNSTAKVYDQYGQPMEAQIEFSVEGTSKAKYEEGNLIEDEVTEDTPYFVVAKYGDLEERQERFLYAPQKDEDTTSLEAEVAELRATVDALLGVENE